VDDYLYQRIERTDVPGEWVFDQPFFIFLNVAVGGNYVGFPTAQTPFPQKMIIDYVRVYRKLNKTIRRKAQIIMFYLQYYDK
jgi:beta-glucanase (GH16 family)